MAHTTAFVTTVVEHWLEREIAQWVHSFNDALNTLLINGYFVVGKNNNNKNQKNQTNNNNNHTH